MIVRLKGFLCQPVCWLIAGLLLGVLGGCAAKPVPPVHEAVQYALVSDLQVRKLVDRCATLNKKTRDLAWTTHKNWWSRNAELVKAADFGLTHYVYQLTPQRQSTSALLALGLTIESVDQANQWLDQLWAGSSDNERLCTEEMQKLGQGQLDLNRDERYYSLLLDLQSRATQTPEAPELVKAKSNPPKGYGRSLYAVEQLGRHEGCPSLTVQLLKSDWPYEVYDLQCTAETHYLATCDWGNCYLINN